MKKAKNSNSDTHIELFTHGMFGHAPRAGERAKYTPLFDAHMGCPSATGGGKSTDNTNLLLRDKMGVRGKFGRSILTAPTCYLPDEFFQCGSLQEVFQLCRSGYQ